jgi:excisionase family DNA binding protein
MDTSALPTLLRIKEAATWLKSSDKTVRRLIDTGKLESVEIRGLRLVRQASLETLMAKGTA